MWLLNNWKIILGALGVISVLGAFWFMRHQAYNQGRADCKAEYEQALIAANDKVISKKKVIHHETQSLDRVGIVAELCKHQWVRNLKDCAD